MNNVSPLPTARTSFITTRKAGKFWAVTLVTPCGRKPLVSRLRVYPDLETAAQDASETAARMQLPLKATAKK